MTNLRSPQARTLGRTIQRARDTAGIGIRELARRLNKPKNPTYVTRLERGEILFTEELLKEVAAAIGVGNDRLYQWLEDFTRLGISPWTPGAANPEQLTTLMGYEREATQITDVGGFIPGLLQTEETARSLIEIDDDAHNVDELIQVRLSRRSVLERRRTATPYALYLEENALRRPVGGPATLREQLDYLIDATKRPNITIRVIPDRVGAYFGMAGPFTILEFESMDPIVYLERLRTGTWLDRREDTEIYFDAVGKVEAIALTAGESMAVIERYRVECGNDTK
ncbi:MULTISPECIES: helix-turn-helix domain-containing protein [Actinoalloteichus]|uniref:helix-turn-helix domain-containing protein n=1 Tax=Actinoalloteichus TaxID=65496 RepID=UPI0018DE92CE|nr:MULTISPECIES: helix-turn-helix transcriptional regulator [Actinoalloteichus]